MNTKNYNLPRMNIFDRMRVAVQKQTAQLTKQDYCRHCHQFVWALYEVWHVTNDGINCGVCFDCNDY